MSDERAPGGRRGRDDDVLPYGESAVPDEARPVRPVWPGTGPGRSESGTRSGGSAAVGATTTARPRPDARAAPRPTARRRARLALSRVDPWSVFVLSLLISVFLGIALVVAVAVLYSLLSSLGVLDAVTSFAQELDVVAKGQALVGLGKVLGVAVLVAAVNVVLLTVLATLSAFLYNVCASVTGGIEVVLSERD